jgi:hypothetical protein
VENVYGQTFHRGERASTSRASAALYSASASLPTLSNPAEAARPQRPPNPAEAAPSSPDTAAAAPPFPHSPVALRPHTAVAPPSPALYSLGTLPSSRLLLRAICGASVCTPPTRPFRSPSPNPPRLPDSQQLPPRSAQTLTSPPSMASLMPSSLDRSALTQSRPLLFSPRVRASGQHVREPIPVGGPFLSSLHLINRFFAIDDGRLGS